MHAKQLHLLLVLAGFTVLLGAIAIALQVRAGHVEPGQGTHLTAADAAVALADRPLPSPVGELPDDAEIARRGKESLQKGKAFAAGHVARDCLAEGMRRVQECNGVVCNVVEQFFTEGCLSQVRADPDLCEGVPARTKGAGTWSAWTLDRCVKEGVDIRRGCSRVLAALQDWCNGGSPR